MLLASLIRRYLKKRKIVFILSGSFKSRGQIYSYVVDVFSHNILSRCLWPHASKTDVIKKQLSASGINKEELTEVFILARWK